MFILMILVGIAMIIFPRFFWWMEIGWKFSSNVEPSTAVLLMNRIGGVFIVLVSIVCLVHLQTKDHYDKQ